MIADIEFGPINIHNKNPKRPIPYYLRRLGEGVRAFRRGVRGTPLTRSLERWMDHKVVCQIGNQEVPGALRAYANIIWEYVDAIDAEDELAPFRFQKVGEMWEIHYAVNGEIKRGIFNDHRGLQHYARLLVAPHRKIESLEMAGKTDPETIAAIMSERQFSNMKRHDVDAIENYKSALELLKEQRNTADYNNDFEGVDRIGEKIEELESRLFPGKKKGDNPNFNTLCRQQEGKSKKELTIHKAVGTAMRRAIEALMDGEMGDLARFLEMSVNPDGYGFAYRPLAPEPNWLL